MESDPRDTERDLQSPVATSGYQGPGLCASASSQQQMRGVGFFLGVWSCVSPGPKKNESA